MLRSTAEHYTARVVAERERAEAVAEARRARIQAGKALELARAMTVRNSELRRQVMHYEQGHGPCEHVRAMNESTHRLEQQRAAVAS